MAKVIDEKTIRYVEELAQLELSGEEREAAGRDMNRLLEYIDQLNELDTSGAEPMTHILTNFNVFREDADENPDAGEEMLANAPAGSKGAFQVPKTVN